MIYKNDTYVENNSYINKDFQSLWEELLDLVPKLTNKWDPAQANESDPLAVLLKVLAIYSDKLNYNIDKSILERFPQTLTELRSAKNVYDTLGYNAPWYKAGSTKIALSYNFKIDDPNVISFTIPRFTMVCNEDLDTLFTIIESDKEQLTFNINDYEDSKKKTRLVDSLQGRINDYQINGVSQITISNLDSNNRLYFVEPNIALNGIFINNSPDFSSEDWILVDNIYQTLSPTSYQFGVDPVSGACYIEFPDTIANTIANGLYIKYIVTDGVNGNVKARSINKYFDESVLAIIEPQTQSKDSIDITSNVSVLNSYAVQNGSNPATIEEMYKNYQKIKNTFDTLVTLLDYENYLYMYKDTLGQNIVSNVRASDRTNDLVDSYKVWLLDTELELFKTEVIKDDSEDVLDYNTVKIYPLNPIGSLGILKKADFDNTFENNVFSENSGAAFGNQSLLNADNTIMGALNKAKVLTTKIDNKPYDLIKVNYDIEGQIYLNHKVSKYAASEIKSNIDKALYKNLNSREIVLGEKPSYESVLNIIQLADDRIQSVDLKPLTFNDVELPTLKYVNNNDAITDQAKKEVIYQKAILNGNTPWAQFDEDFTYRAYQLGASTKSFEADDSNDIEITSLVSLSNKDRIYYEVLQNEDLVAFAPQYQDKKTYANYLYYYISGGTAGSVIAKKNTPTKLPQGVNILIYNTKDEAKNYGGFGTHYSYIIKSNSFIRCNFDLICDENQSNDPPSLNNNKLISEIGYVQSSLSKNTNIQWITNSKNLIDKLESSSPTWDDSDDKPNENTYVLMTGEYFIFRNIGEDAFTFLGEGNSIGNTTDMSGYIISNQTIINNWFNQDWDLIIEGEGLQNISWLTSNGENFHYRLNQIYIFGLGYQFTYVNDDSILDDSEILSFEGWLGNGEPFEIGKGENLKYSLKSTPDVNSNNLPKLLNGDMWQGIIRLNYYLDNTNGFELIKGGTLNYVTHQQKIVIKDKDSTTNYPVGASYPLYLKSNIILDSPGGLKLNISKDTLNTLLGEGSKLLIQNYQKYDVSKVEEGIYFDEFLDDGGNFIVPGDDSNTIAIFGAYSTQNTTTIGGLSLYESGESVNIVKYFAAKGGTSLTIQGIPIFISLIKVANKDEIYGYYQSNKDATETLESLFANNEVIVKLDATELGDLNFNPTHTIPSNDLIEDPTEAESYFNKNHPVNRYVLPKLSNLTNLKINQNSIDK